ncbi:methyltransferase domain-containing protein [Zoogloea dura]|uniref:Malonyl-[acyl-carrier protein] O-methyltransferase n=1 Tax=Zoogloea dura TaxID=2728840 RepID=A0A848G299_9RHOO|nr:methyltransferase domain-containing protein [Zoogloea dura]NML25352.1 methyltransferase domain-containing protein [Zoogloea dura]
MSDAPAPKHAVRAAFDKAADAYDAVAAVQRSACDRLLDLVAATPSCQPGRILDAGTGTGYALPGLQRLFPAAALIALDFAPAMLKRQPAGLALPLCADLEHLPLADASLDALWSSYALQWCAPRQALPELARSLRPGGQLWLASLGPGTLQELRDAFRHVDQDEHVLSFQPPEVLEDAAEDAGLRILTSERDTLHAWAPDLRGLLRDIKTLGAHQTGAPRRRAPLGKQAWSRLAAAYEVHRTPAGLPASYDTLWIIAEKK